MNQKIEGYTSKLSVKIDDADMVLVRNSSTGRTFSLTADEASDLYYLLKETLRNLASPGFISPPDQF